MTGSSPVGPDGLGEGGREFETLTIGDKKTDDFGRDPVIAD
jgi:hypothetical protein